MKRRELNRLDARAREQRLEDGTRLAVGLRVFCNGEGAVEVVGWDWAGVDVRVEKDRRRVSAAWEQLRGLRDDELSMFERERREKRRMDEQAVFEDAGPFDSDL